MELSIRQSAARNAGEQSTQTSEENGQVSQANEVPARQLSPVDGGWPAWTVLIAGFIFEALLWGQYNHVSYPKLPFSCSNEAHILRRRVSNLFWCLPELLFQVARI